MSVRIFTEVAARGLSPRSPTKSGKGTPSSLCSSPLSTKKTQPPHSISSPLAKEAKTTTNVVPVNSSLIPIQAASTTSVSTTSTSTTNANGVSETVQVDTKTMQPTTQVTDSTPLLGSEGFGKVEIVLDFSEADQTSSSSSQTTPSQTQSKSKDRREDPMRAWINARKFKLEDFDLGVTLGMGSFGRVRFCKFSKAVWSEILKKTCCSKALSFFHHPTPPCMAIKMLKKSEIIRESQLEHIFAEKEIMKDISSGIKRDVHPFIVEYITSFQDPTCVYVVMEYINGGEFFSHLRASGCFEDHIAKFYCASVVSIFEYLHEDNIVYRDLKPENLLLTHDGYLKLTDFGFAKRVANKTYTLCGTPEYISPEVLLNQGHGKEVDWWTLGILTYEMLVGQPPFVSDDPMEIYKMVLRGKIEYPRWLENGSKSLIRHLADPDISKRYGCRSTGSADVKNHRWLASIDFQQLVQKKLSPPLAPATTGPDDTSNYEDYRDSVELPRPYNYAEHFGSDPFEKFDL